MKLIQAAVVSLGLTFSGCAMSANIDDAPAKAIGFKASQLAGLDARMKQFVLDGHVYGIHTRLVQGGEVKAETIFGLRDVIENKPIEDDTIYRIYSMTKPVTGVAMMQLYEQGKWKLDDPVTKFIPEFENLQVLSGQNEAGDWQLEAAVRAPTMSELMSHTAGFAYGLAGSDPANTAFRAHEILRSPDLDSMVTKVAEVPLLFQPGERWEYSAAVDLQGAIIERITGQPLGEYFKQNIFEPLGMEDTAFYVSAENYDRFSQVFGYNPENGMLVPVPFETVMFKKDTIALEAGGAGLISTMDDYSVFAQTMLSGGSYNGIELLKPETVELMRTNVLTDDMVMWSTGTLDDAEYKGLGFGLGFGVVTDPTQRVANYGEGTFFWGGAAGTWFWIDPANDLYFIGMIQLFDNNAPEKVDFRTISAEHIYNYEAE